MFKFDGELSTVSKLYDVKQGQKMFAIVLPIGMSPLIIFNILLAFNTSLLLLIFVPAILGVIVSAICLCIPKDWNKTRTCHIEIDEELMKIELENYFERATEDVKKVLDYGEFYEFRFYFPWCFGVICQKDLLVEGTIEEFEKFFDGKIVRKKLKLKV